ncbi:FAD/FMN-containing dehydrogenase [Lipingzhangella halophila]|uniref:FAD/FMN-containing dehydrogenase n=1 Tax=Lipingzhangella halophila TaxID=1783352 RepID=A0A7W7RL83_9ACTN|nr:FAD-binding oxidoreductase [Lipingzhangella halophila]MBB4934054.1 FAD/FMN-containing dehydrogenase [Lipingzhangella halophila]
MPDSHPATAGANAPFPDIVGSLRAELSCEVTGPGDTDWEKRRVAWNTHVDQHPAAVVVPEGAEDIRAAVAFARKHALAVAVQPNGHGATTALSGTILIRPVRLRDITVDTERRRVRVQAGAKWKELQEALDGTGLMGLPGSTADNSVIGYHLGGGLSWFGRTYGPAAEYIRSLEVVTPEGELREVTAENDPELFWALCGGGGDFGVVVSMEIELLDERPVYGGRLMWAAEHAEEVLRAYVATTRAAPVELSVWLWFVTFPPIDAIPAELQGRSFANVDATFLGTAEDAEKYLDPLREVPGMEADTLGPVSVTRIDEVAGEPTDPMPAVDWSQLVTKIDEEFLKRLLELNWPGGGSPVVAQLRHVGGALARPGATAASGLAGEYLLTTVGVPITEEDAEAIHRHDERLEAALADRLAGYGHPNMLGHDTRTQRAHSPENLEHLRRIKRERDPAGVLRGNRPVLGSPG